VSAACIYETANRYTKSQVHGVNIIKGMWVEAGGDGHGDKGITSTIQRSVSEKKLRGDYKLGEAWG
jgi:hypothetical protein